MHHNSCPVMSYCLIIWIQGIRQSVQTEVHDNWIEETLVFSNPDLPCLCGDAIAW